MIIADMYVNLINNGQMTFNDVPAQYQSDVKNILSHLPIKFLYYNYGLEYKMIDTTSYTPKAGEIIFDSLQTATQLVTDFASVAGKITFTILTNAVSADTITVQDVKLTAGADFSIGSDIPTTTKNISDALNLITKFSTYFTASESNAIITITEKIPGNKNTPENITTTGTISISNGTITKSVYGYKNAMIAQQLVALNSTYVNKMYPIERGLVTAYANKNTDTVSALETTLSTLQSEYKTKAQAIING